MIEQRPEYKTETISLILNLEDSYISRLVLAQFIVQHKLYSLLLENDEVTSYLVFEINSTLLLRNLIPEDEFIGLITDVVKLNKTRKHQSINILLLDKIKNFEEVYMQLNRMQRIDIENGIP